MGLGTTQKKLRNVLLYTIFAICVLALSCVTWERIQKYVNRKIIVEETVVPFTAPPNIVICPYPNEERELESQLQFCSKHKLACGKNDSIEDIVIKAGLPLSEFYDVEQVTPEESVKSVTVKNFGEPKVNVDYAAWKKTPYFLDQRSWPPVTVCYSLDFASFLSSYKIPIVVHMVFKNITDVSGGDWGTVFIDANDDRRYLYNAKNRLHLRNHEYAKYIVSHNKRIRQNVPSNFCQSDQMYNYTKCRMDYICAAMKQRDFKCQPYQFDCKEKLATCSMDKVQEMVNLMVHSEELRHICPEKCSKWNSILSYEEGNSKFDSPELRLVFEDYDITIREEHWSDSLFSFISQLGVLASILFGLISILGVFKIRTTKHYEEEDYSDAKQNGDAS